MQIGSPGLMLADDFIEEQKSFEKVTKSKIRKGVTC